MNTHSLTTKHTNVTSLKLSAAETEYQNLRSSHPGSLAQLEQSFHKNLHIKTSSPGSSPRRSSLTRSSAVPLGIVAPKVAPNKKFVQANIGVPAPRLGKTKKSGSMSLITSVKEKSLPCFVNNKMPEFNCVSSEIVSQLLDGAFKNVIDESYIIDCRFRYEYDGGHIRGSLNMPVPEEVKVFLEKPKTNKKIVLIFHCEFSSHRGPTTLKYLRKLDRIANWEKWPELYYPELYLLAGGYERFYKEKPEYCEPRSYVSMFDRNYRQVCKGEIKEQRRLSLQRSVSFSGPFGRNKFEFSNNENSENMLIEESSLLEEKFSFEDEKENYPNFKPPKCSLIRENSFTELPTENIQQNSLQSYKTKRNLFNSFQQRLSASTSALQDIFKLRDTKSLVSLDEEETLN